MRVSTSCHAKVNLCLSVGPADRTGLHPIRTVFQTVGLTDELSIEESPEGTDILECDWDGMPLENTLTKTLRLIREIVAVPPLKMTLVKRIPAQSGLGGGSSNAAGLLRCLSRVVGGVSPQLAYETSVAVGADVAFFLIGGRCRGLGYGEILEPVSYTERAWTVIVVPPVGVSTGGAYKALDAFALELVESPKIGHNAFEKIAPPECLAAISHLRGCGGAPAMLSGSGSAVFGMFDSHHQAGTAARLAEENSLGSVFLAETTTAEESVSVTL